MSCSLGAMGRAQRKALTQERRRGEMNGAEVSVQVARAAKNLPASEGDARGSGQSLGREGPLEEEVTTYSSILAQKIPWTEEPCGL